MIPVWKGSCNQWDCDEMGHMNVRVYVQKAMEGLAVFAAEIGMPHAFRAEMPSTLIPADQHIRFIREVHPGRPLTMRACVLEVGETDAVIYQDMQHSDGSYAAAFRTRIVHAHALTEQPFPWSKRSRAALEALKGKPPKDTAPRSIDPVADILPPKQATLATAETVGAPLIGLGSVSPQHCDVYGRMNAEWFMGRISDSVPNLLYDWRRGLADKAGGKRVGAAVLEYRLIYRRWPRAGDTFQVRSALGKVAEKTHSLVHWLLDPETGAAWVTTEAVAVTFDLDTRKIIPTTDDYKRELEALVPSGLSL